MAPWQKVLVVTGVALLVTVGSYLYFRPMLWVDRFARDALTADTVCLANYSPFEWERLWVLPPFADIDRFPALLTLDWGDEGGKLANFREYMAKTESQSLVLAQRGFVRWASFFQDKARQADGIGAFSLFLPTGDVDGMTPGEAVFRVERQALPGGMTGLILTRHPAPETVPCPAPVG